MEIKRMAMAMATARGDRLSDLPESILLHILSMLPDRKQVVRTSMLSTRWRFLWMSVPVSLYFEFPEEEEMGRPHQQILDFVTSTHRELHYWRSCQKIRDFTILFNSYQKKFIADVDLWVSFATKLANVEEFTLCLLYGPTYQFPQFAYKNKSLRSLDLGNCTLNPSANVNWRGLVSLSLRHINLMEGVMEKVLSGCPNLECLELENFSGFHSLEISSVKMRKLIITNYRTNVYDVWLEILAPHIQNLQLFWLHRGICLRNVASLVTAVINFDFDLDIKHGYQMQRKLSGCLKELLHSVAHVKNLELSPWCIECLSVLELEGWQPPPSSWKFLQLSTALKQWDFPGICRFLPSSLDLETLVINGCTYQSRDLLSRYTNEDEQIRRFETHNFNCSFPHLKTIKILNFNGSMMPLVKYLLENATVLEKFVIAAKLQRGDEPQDYVKMTQEFQSFPRSSPHASVVFSYR